MAIFSKLLIKFYCAWLRSQLRVLLLRFSHFHLPRLLAKQPKAEVYLALNDPFSFMLIQMLARLEKQCSVTFKLYLVYQAVPGVTLAPHLLRKWAIKDANFIAKQHQLTAINQYPSANALLTGQLLWQLSKQDISSAVTIFHQTWFDQFERYYSTSTPVINFQINNLQRLLRQGHYQPATIFFAGDWFTGVDRLHYFKATLSVLKLLQEKPCTLTSNEQAQAAIDKDDKPLTEAGALEVYISIRSPYSYLGFVKAKRLAQSYQIPLIIKPLLPLMMRGYTVPKVKQKYIYYDASREAVSANIAFDSFCDPLGQGVINCYQLFSYAQSQDKAIAYIEAVFNAIYVKGLDIADNSVLQAICSELAIDYQAAKDYDLNHDWQQWADCHQVALDDMGFWGVPCFKYGDISCWGQDRLEQITQAIIKQG